MILGIKFVDWVSGRGMEVEDEESDQQDVKSILLGESD